MIILYFTDNQLLVILNFIFVSFLFLPFSFHFALKTIVFSFYSYMNYFSNSRCVRHNYKKRLPKADSLFYNVITFFTSFLAYHHPLEALPLLYRL